MKFDPYQHDLATPDGRVISLTKTDAGRAQAIVLIEGINPNFIGFELDPQLVTFNIKSTLAQLGVDGRLQQFELNKEKGEAHVSVELFAIGPVARELLTLFTHGIYIGKLFAADDRRRVRDPDYLLRMFGRVDRWGRPLLSLGGMHGSDSLILDKIDGRTVAYLALKNGRLIYDPTVFGFLATLARALQHRRSTRELLKLHQQWVEGAVRNIDEDEILLLQTAPLHIRTVFGKVVDSLLAPGYCHTSASVLQPDTKASGDIYEFFGKSKREITDLPLEFYTLEPYREHVLFTDRDQLRTLLDDENAVFSAFKTAPQLKTHHSAIFIVKGEQMKALQANDWVVHEPVFQEFPGITQGSRQTVLVERYIQSQPIYPFLKAIEDGYITSQGVLFTRYFPTPLSKRSLLSEQVARCLKGIYFQYPSFSHREFFSQEDRALLIDLYKFAIPVYWVDEITGKVLQYVQKKHLESGVFVPRNAIDTYLKAVLFGVYGSNLISGSFENELKKLLQGVIALKSSVNHALLQPNTPLALVTGGGPGAMEVGNHVAKELNILSCANIADFHVVNGVINEQKQNPYIEAKMTYRLKQLVERQAEFNLDFPIFVMGGIGTDFEFCLEEVRRKVGAVAPTPVLLFGSVDYWKAKITHRFECNLASKTILGSEWVSNCFYAIQTAEQGLQVYRKFFTGQLAIGKEFSPAPLGFHVVTW